MGRRRTRQQHGGSIHGIHSGSRALLAQDKSRENEEGRALYRVPLVLKRRQPRAKDLAPLYFVLGSEIERLPEGLPPSDRAVSITQTSEFRVKIEYKQASTNKVDDKTLKRLRECEKVVQIIEDVLHLNEIEPKNALNAFVNILPRLARMAEMPFEVFNASMQKALKLYEKKWDEL